MTTIIDPWHSRPLDVHRWSDHPEAKKVVDKVWGEYFSDPTGTSRGPKQKTTSKDQLKVLILDLYVAWLEDPTLSIGVSLSSNAWQAKSRYNALHISKKIIPIIKTLIGEGPLDLARHSHQGPGHLLRREADIAIRHVRPDQPNLLMRRVRDEVMGFYASTTYLQNKGEPTKADVSSHQIISFVDEDRMLDYLLPIGLDLARANFRLSSSSQLVALEMARRGLGIIIAPDWIAQGLTDFVHVLDEVEPFSIPTWLVTHSEMKTRGC